MELCHLATLVMARAIARGVFEASSLPHGGAQASCDKIKDGIFDMLVSFDVRQGGTAINTLISSMLQSDQPAGAANTTVYTLNSLITKDNMTPNSCWSMNDLH